MGSTAYVQGPELHVLLDLCLISKNKTHLIVFILLHTYGNNYINPTLSLIQSYTGTFKNMDNLGRGGNIHVFHSRFSGTNATT